MKDTFASPVLRGRWPEGPEGESPSPSARRFQIMVFKTIFGAFPLRPV